MKIYKRLTVAILSLPLLMGTMPAFAEAETHAERGNHAERGKHNACNGKVRPKQLLRDITLTDAQEEKFKAINKKNREKYMAKKANKANKMKENFNLHNQMQDHLLATTFDEKKVRELAEKMTSEQVNRRVERIQAQHELLQILTPEQKVKVKANMEKMAQNCKGAHKQDHKNSHSQK